MADVWAVIEIPPSAPWEAATFRVQDVAEESLGWADGPLLLSSAEEWGYDKCVAPLTYYTRAAAQAVVDLLNSLADSPEERALADAEQQAYLEHTKETGHG